MGFASKISMGFFPKAKQDAALAADTEFGADPVEPRPQLQAVPSTAPDAAADEASPLRLGNIMRRKRGVAAADEAETEVQLPLIGHLSLARQLRILLMVFGAGILVTVFALWRNSVASSVASAQTQIASDALMHSQRVGKAAPNAIQGSPEAFTQLQESRVELTKDLNLLARGGDFGGRSIPSASAGVAKTLTEARTKWVSSDNAAGTILKV